MYLEVLGRIHGIEHRSDMFHCVIVALSFRIGILYIDTPFIENFLLRRNCLRV
jgi:hypothetical protein